MALSERRLKTVLVDIDLSGRLSSSEKNAGGVRATWWQAVNIALCRASIAYYETIAAEVAFKQRGYLWLYDDATWPQALAHVPLQRGLGQPIEELTPPQITQKVPEIDKIEGIAGATFSPKDGLINPNLLKEHYRRRSRDAGAKYRDRVYVHSVEVGADGVTLGCWEGSHQLSEEGLTRMMTQDGPGRAERGRLETLRAARIAITGGAWSVNV